MAQFSRRMLLAWLVLGAACQTSSTLQETRAVIDVSPAEHLIPRMYVGEERRGTFTIRNTGDGALQIRAMSVAGSTVVTLIDARAEEIAPGNSVDVAWLLRSESPQLVDATVRIESNASGKGEFRLQANVVATPTCNDGNDCTRDSFDVTSSTCFNDPVAGACDDGDVCTTADTCVDGSCRGVPIDCADNVACTLETCDFGLGCRHLPTSSLCADEDPCSVDYCDATTGCGHARALDGTPCAPQDGCNTVYLCQAGACLATPTPNGYPCEDGEVCTVGDACWNGVCQGSRAATPPTLMAFRGLYGAPGAEVVPLRRDRVVYVDASSTDSAASPRAVISVADIVNDAPLLVTQSSQWPWVELAHRVDSQRILVGGKGRAAILFVGDDGALVEEGEVYNDPSAELVPTGHVAVLSDRAIFCARGYLLIADTSLPVPAQIGFVRPTGGCDGAWASEEYGLVVAAGPRLLRGVNAHDAFPLLGEVLPFAPQDVMHVTGALVAGVNGTDTGAVATILSIDGFNGDVSLNLVGDSVRVGFEDGVMYAAIPDGDLFNLVRYQIGEDGFTPIRRQTVRLESREPRVLAAGGLVALSRSSGELFVDEESGIRLLEPGTAGGLAGITAEPSAIVISDGRIAQRFALHPSGGLEHLRSGRASEHVSLWSLAETPPVLLSATRELTHLDPTTQLMVGNEQIQVGRWLTSDDQVTLSATVDDDAPRWWWRVAGERIVAVTYGALTGPLTLLVLDGGDFVNGIVTPLGPARTVEIGGIYPRDVVISYDPDADQVALGVNSLNGEARIFIVGADGSTPVPGGIPLVSDREIRSLAIHDERVAVLASPSESGLNVLRLRGWDASGFVSENEELLLYAPVGPILFFDGATVAVPLEDGVTFYTLNGLEVVGDGSIELGHPILASAPYLGKLILAARTHLYVLDPPCPP